MKPTKEPPSYTAPPPDEADLPSYAEAVHEVVTTSTSNDDVVQPVILVLDGQAIYADTDPTVHLYEVNRGLASLGEATLAVEFTRLEQRSGSSTNRRARHIYSLRRKPPPMHLRRVTGIRNHEKGHDDKNTPDYYIQSVAAPSRRLGHLGFQANSTRGGQWSATVLPVDMKGWTERDYPPFVAGAAPVFSARQRQGACKWMLGDGGADTDGAQDVAMDVTAREAGRIGGAMVLPGVAEVGGGAASVSNTEAVADVCAMEEISVTMTEGLELAQTLSFHAAPWKERASQAPDPSAQMERAMVSHAFRYGRWGEPYKYFQGCCR